MPNFKQTIIQAFILWTVLMLAVGAVSALAARR
jgi:hypothetical protein